MFRFSLQLSFEIFLGAFTKLRKATISFVVSVRLSAWTRLPLDGFSWNLIFEYFSKKTVEKFKFHSNRTRIKGAFHEGQYTFLIISRSFLLRMKNVSDKSRRENRNTHPVFSNFFIYICRKSWRLRDNMEKKYIVDLDRPQMTIQRLRIACWIRKATNTLSEYVMLIAFPQQWWLHERAPVLPFVFYGIAFIPKLTV